MTKLKKLVTDAEDELKTLQGICEEKALYYKNETQRRKEELLTAENAQGLFDNVLSKLSSRVKERTENIHAGAEAGSDLSRHVETNKGGITADFDARAGARQTVVF